MTDFQTFKLAEPIGRALTASGYTTPTPIQIQAIPIILSGRDLLGVAQTGTGKTLAFAAPILHQLHRSRKTGSRCNPRALVLAPTRELAAQIAKSFLTYGKFLDVSVVTVFGGAKINGQIRQIERGVDVLVATPGRLLDLCDQGVLSLKAIEMLVLDEADQMLDLGFIHALRRIVREIPRERQTLLFSATMPKSISRLAADYLSDPAKVSVAPPATVAQRVEQSIFFAEQRAKPALLAHTLRQPDVRRALVFSRTKHGADRVVRQLGARSIDALAIHGNKSQPQRQRALEAFRSGKCWVLIATDVAARGIDIDGVTHVINYDLPNVPEQYVHRIGRTARAGATGTAISFVSNDERGYLRGIEKLTRLQLSVSALPDGLEAAPEPEAKRPRPPKDANAANAKRRGGRKRRRPARAKRPLASAD